jgi:hypothetical protein
MLEIVILAISISWLVLLVDVRVCYANIRKEQQELAQLKEKIDHTEESIQRVKGLLAAIKNS